MAEPTVTPIIPPADDAPPKRVKEEKPPKAAEPSIGPKGPGSTGTASGKPGKLHRELAEMLALPAVAFELRGDSFCAYVWTIRSEPFAYALGDLAEKNPALKRKLQMMMEGGAYGQLIFTGAALIVPILAYYGIYPSSMFNPFALSEKELGEFQAMMGARGNGRYQGSNDADSIPHPVSPEWQP